MLFIWMQHTIFVSAKKEKYYSRKIIIDSMLSKIVSISGKPGLHKLVSTSKNINVAESLVDGKRFPIYMSEKVVALSDVSIYTDNEDVPLKEVFAKIKEKQNGAKVEINKKWQNKDFFGFFEEILPEYDKDKVYASDVKKLLLWYNILIENNIDFEAEEVEENTDSSDKE